MSEEYVVYKYIMLNKHYRQSGKGGVGGMKQKSISLSSKGVF